MKTPRHDDTIAAIATPPGRGAIGILRLSGRHAGRIAERVCGALPEPRQVALRDFRDADGTIIDRGLVIRFAAPGSFTGEDIVELQTHGSPVVLDMLLQALLAHGARLAQPGEFSQRAFLNDRMDLAQAEAIADLIDSSSAEAARSAARSMQGAFSAAVDDVQRQLTHLRVYVEASIDFSDEEIDLPNDTRLGALFTELQDSLRSLIARARNGVILRDGATLVLAGRPNAGKSSILNRLSGRDIAIVTAIPGTTRDVLRQELVIDGIPFHVIDTAGLRESGDEIEQEGVRRALAEIGSADRLLLVVDGTNPQHARETLDELRTSLRHDLPAVSLILNKCDQAISRAHPLPQERDSIPLITVSARTGQGMDELREHLKQIVGYQSTGSGDFSARRRHLDALQRTLELVAQGMTHLQRDAAAELLAENLRHAQTTLGEITGEFTADDLLGKIFADFCIGK